MKKIDPFTKTPGIAGTAFIKTHCSDEIINNFESEESYKFVYKITGIRGSGKSVEYAEIIKYFKQQKNWLVYTLSAAGTPLNTLVSLISQETFFDSETHSTTVNSNANVAGNIFFSSGGSSIGSSKTSSYNSNYYDAEATLKMMVKKICDNGYRILIGVDDISRTQEMVAFLSVLDSLIKEYNNVHFVCTGLSKNIEDFSKDASLTFFKRSDICEMQPLNKFEMIEKYQELLGVDFQVAKEMALYTKGYAYAYQVLGTLYFSKKTEETFTDIIPKFDKTLFSDSYELIWKELTEAEKELIKCIYKVEGGKVGEIKKLLNNPANFPVLRVRLIKKHIINTSERGKITIDLPDFKRYVEEWGD